ncbi:MAG: IS30 family transposase [Selenomonadaceae bacterium]|nr:IS30 family transposase [Selenomonadaceae bacterium]
MTDRKSRYLICQELKSRTSAEVNAALIGALKNEPLESITPDRGRHAQITAELGVEFCFPPPHQPCERGTNENTKGLLREYYTKGCDFGKVSEEDLQDVVKNLNNRPRKKSGYQKL